MATVDSSWVYRTQEIFAPSFAGDSDWDFNTALLENPTATGHSDWAFETVTLDPPAGFPKTDSEWGPLGITLYRPHHPIAVLTLSGLEYTNVVVFDGTTVR